MNLIALLIGLAVERLATHLFHLRELRWPDRVIDWGFAQIERLPGWPPLLLVVAIAAVLALPVLIARLALDDVLFGFPYLVFAIVVLFFSLGPRDIAEETENHCEALSVDDTERVEATAKALLERDPPQEPAARSRAVEEAICVQGNNRLFAVVFWFIVFGPLGAWTYRVTDLIRRRAVFRSGRDPDGETPASMMVGAAEDLHGWIAWIPARLTAVSYALAGSFDEALTAWRTRTHPADLRARERNDALLARVGTGALALKPIEHEQSVERGIRGAMAARRLVYRSLFIWAAVIAAMTLYGWSG